MGRLGSGPRLVADVVFTHARYVRDTWRSSETAELKRAAEGSRSRSQRRRTAESQEFIGNVLLVMHFSLSSPIRAASTAVSCAISISLDDYQGSRPDVAVCWSSA